MTKLFGKKHILLFNLLSIGFILLIGFIVIRHTFSLSIFGDDWLALYRYRYHAGEWSDRTFNIFTYFLTSYGSQDVIMGLINKFFGYNPQTYYFISFILRAAVSVSLFIILKKLTNKYVPAFLSSVFFFVSSIGLEAT